MPRKRQIKYLYWHRLADGTEAAYWKPSPQLRAAGWQNRRIGQRDALGNGEVEAIGEALELNRRLAEWRAGKDSRATPPPPPRKLTFSDLVDEYHRSDEWRALAPKTQANYETRLRQLERWALDGTLAIRAIDRAMVRDLKTALLAPRPRTGDDGRTVMVPPAVHKCASVLRVLRLLLNFAIAHDWLTENATDKVPIPQAPPRRNILLPAQVDAVDAAATAAGEPAIGFAFTLGLWTLQREGDLLALTRMSWRRFDNVDPADAAVLAARDGPNAGNVMGFRLLQKKTGVWVDCPLPPWLHDRVEAAFQRSQWLIPDRDNPARACHEKTFQRRARQALDGQQLPDFQFRDLRRSGMSMLRDLGVADPTPISGHKILGVKSILDTYMPANTRAACAAMAQAIRTLQVREAREAAR